MASIQGGQKFEKALAELAKTVAVPATLKVGFLSGSTYPDGTSVALVAAVNNFGAPSRGQPPRPFMSNWVKDKSGEWPSAIAALLKSNDLDAVKTLGQAGEALRGQLQQAIRDFVGVPLKPATIARKGFDKQLIDSSHMLNSVDYEVRTA